jgi:23S rRNA (adenine2503-C2)-methyltransferase
MTCFYGLNPSEIEKIISGVGAPKFRVKQILEWLYKKHVLSWEEMKTLPKELRELLAGCSRLTALLIEERPAAVGEGTAKFLFKTLDGHFLESVLISQRDRETVCVSTQLGCAVRCPICASGKTGLLRNLTAGEIIEQIAWIARKTGCKITNVVFMGMGEPLDNFDEVMKALEILTASWGFEMGGRKITVSTSGVPEKIYEFVKKTEGRIRLSVSLHSPDDETRSKLIPYNRKYPLKELLKTLGKIHHDLKRDITFEYTLVDGVNDSEDDARAVAKIAKLLQAKINLIPYNPIREIDWKTPPQERMTKFRETLERSGVRSTFRKTMGRETEAACGQLRLDRLRETKAA